jgi:hypothetical protein
MNPYLKKNGLLFQIAIVLIAVPLCSIIFFALAGSISSDNIIGYFTFLACLSTTVVVLSWMIYRLYRELTVRIGSIRRVVKELSEGKSIDEIKIEKNDELAEIEAALNDINKKNLDTSEFTKHLITNQKTILNELAGYQDDLTSNLLELKKTLSNHQEEEHRRQWAAESQAKFVEILRTNDNIKSLANEVIKNLVQILNAAQGALFVAEEQESGNIVLDLKGCYAYKRIKHLSFALSPGEGLVGQTFLEKQTNYLKKVPSDYIQIRSGLGDANPQSILIVPFLFEERVIALAELASFKDFKNYEIEFVEKVGESIAHSIASTQTTEKTQKLLDDSIAQAEQLKSQEEELRQNQEELQATQEEISRKYDELFRKLKELNYQSKFDQLKAINSTKKRSIEYYFNIIRNQMITFSENKMVVNAVKEFKDAYYQIAEALTEEQIENIRTGVRHYYESEFIVKLNENSDELDSVEKYIPSDTRTLLYQSLYISENPHPTGQKSLLNHPGDDSKYSSVHASYHPVLKNFLEKFGYYDIFLIDSETGEMLYSVFKEVDFATNLLTGIYSNTNFGRVVKEAIESTDNKFVKLIDFEPYDPSYKAPASFIACPIYDGDVKIGILVFQMPINKINQILTGDNNWKADGLGKTGETTIIGSDTRLRSMSRKLIEQQEEYYAALERIGYDSLTLHQMQKSNTSILLERMNIDSVRKAVKGETGTIIESNNVGITTLNAYAPLEIADVNWILLSSMEEQEASEVINDLKKL